MKKIPDSLLKAFIKTSDDKWLDDELYAAYRKEAEDYLGEDAPEFEFAKLVVPLARMKMGIDV